MKVKSESEVAQSCPTLSDPKDCSLPGSSVHGIFQARVLEWGAIAKKDEMKVKAVQSCLTLCDPMNCSTPGLPVSERAMAPHSSTLAWKIPWTEEPGRLQSMGSLRIDTTE